jgi:hypothetical protein
MSDTRGNSDKAGESDYDNPPIPSGPIEHIRIYLRVKGQLSLSGVGGFLDELAFQVRDISSMVGSVGLVSIKTGSLELVVAVSALAVSAAQFVLQLKDRFKKDPVLAHFTLLVSAGRGVPDVTISGGGETVTTTALEIRKAPELRTTILPSRDSYYLTSIYRHQGGTFAAVGSSRALLRVVDHRAGSPRLEAGRYLIWGGIAVEGREGAVLHVHRTYSR